MSDRQAGDKCMNKDCFYDMTTGRFGLLISIRFRDSLEPVKSGERVEIETDSGLLGRVQFIYE